MVKNSSSGIKASLSFLVVLLLCISLVSLGDSAVNPNDPFAPRTIITTPPKTPTTPADTTTPTDTTKTDEKPKDAVTKSAEDVAKAAGDLTGDLAKVPKKSLFQRGVDWWTGGSEPEDGDDGIDGTDDTAPDVSSPRPDPLCKEDTEYKFDATKLNSAINNVTITEGEIDEDTDKDLIDQWCASLGEPGTKKEFWNTLKGASSETKQKFFDVMGKKYNMNLGSLGSADFEPDADGNLLIGKNKIKINMDLESYLGKESREFEFRGEGYEYGASKLDKIGVDNEGNVQIDFSNGKAKSSIALKGKDVGFDPETMKITSNGQDYSWNGQGTVDFNGPDGKLKMNFARGGGDNDVTNFPIMVMPNGEQISPFQEEVSGVEWKSEWGEKPTGEGYTVDPEGKYTIDSKGTVRKVMSTEVTIDETGKVEAIKDGYMNNPELKGDLFASGEFGIGKSDKYKSYFDLTGDSLTIVTNGNNKLYYALGTDLKKLDVKGSGLVYIRNGDYMLKFHDGGKLDVWKLPAELQTGEGAAKGKYAHTIQEIVNVNDPKNPFKIIEGKDKTIALTDSSGKPIDLTKFAGGKVRTPPKPGEETDVKPGEVTKDGPPSLKTDMNIKVDPVSDLRMEDGTSNTGELIIDEATWDSLTDEEKKMDRGQLLEKLITEGKISYDVTFKTTYFGPKRDGTIKEKIASLAGTQVTIAQVKQTIGGKGLDKLFAKFGNDKTPINPNDKLSISINAGKATVSFQGKTVIASDSENKIIIGILRKQLTAKASSPPMKGAKITFTGNTDAPMNSIFSSYEYQWNQKHPQ